jgi:ribosomal protein S27AE
VRLRAAPIDPSTLPEDLGVDWSRWSDGRAYRLKRKKDFPNVNPGLARTACEEAATKMGKVARTVRDKMVPEKLIWVQFADAEIRIGEPCPRCGSRRILNLHADMARCPQCQAQLLLSNEGLEALDEDEDQDDGEVEATEEMTEEEAQAVSRKTKSERLLHSLQNVHLQRSGEAGPNELYSGWAEDEGGRIILLAEFAPSPHGEELSLDNMDERILLAKKIPAHLLEGLVDVNELAVRPDADWDLIFSFEPAEPAEPA